MKLFRSGAQAASVQYLLLHGFGADRLSWTGIAPMLAKDYGVLLADLPGHGESYAADAPDFATLIRQTTRLLAEDADWQAAKTRHVIGHSLGGALAIALAADDTALHFDSLTLIAPAGVGAALDSNWLQRLVSLDSEQAVRNHLSGLVDNPNLIPPMVATLLLRHLEMPGVLAKLSRYIDWLPNLDLQAEINAVKIRARVIWGKQDRIVPWQDGLLKHLDPDPLLLDECGHLPHIEHRARVFEAIHALNSG